jgi:hypothetical protein
MDTEVRFPARVWDFSIHNSVQRPSQWVSGYSDLHLCLVPRLRVRATILPPSTFTTWCLIKHSDRSTNFTSTLYVLTSSFGSMQFHYYFIFSVFRWCTLVRITWWILYKPHLCHFEFFGLSFLIFPGASNMFQNCFRSNITYVDPVSVHYKKFTKFRIHETLNRFSSNHSSSATMGVVSAWMGTTWEQHVHLPITMAARSNGAHTRTSLAREFNSARVTISRTCPCVGRHAHTCVVKLIRVRLLAEPNSYVYGLPKAWMSVCT